MSKFRLIVISVACAGISGCSDGGPAGLLIPRASLNPGTYTGMVRGSTTSGGSSPASQTTATSNVMRVDVIGPSGLPSVGGREIRVGDVQLLELGRISLFMTVAGIDKNSDAVVVRNTVEMQVHESNILVGVLTGRGWHTYKYAGPNTIIFSMHISTTGTVWDEFYLFRNDAAGTLTR